MSRFKKFSLIFISIILPFIIGSSKYVSPEDNFTLSNYTTFSPGSEVTINLYSYNNRNQRQAEFSFTLFRITDPIKFYSEINSSYGFDIIGKNKDILLKYTEKVKVWASLINGNNSYGKGNVTVGKIGEPGIYIVQAIREGLVGYCAIAVTDKSIVYKNSSDQVLAFLTDVRTSEFIKEVKFTLVYNKKTQSTFADKDGIVLFEVEEGKNPDFENRPLLIAQSGKETIISNPYLYFGNHSQITAYIYTNQPIYRPGQEVYFKGILREEDGNELKNIGRTEFTVSVKSSKNKEVYSAVLTADDLGTINGSLKLGEEADLGNYSITLSKGENNYYSSFEVQEYKKPEFMVKVELPKSNYANKDEIKGKVKADYYFGSPVTTGTVALKIYKRYYWRPWWYWSDFSWFYRSYEKIGPINYRNMQFVKQLDGILNSKGEFEFSIQAFEEPYFDYVYVFSAEITDASRNTVAGSSEVNITRGSFSIFTSPDKYFTEKGKPVNLKVNAADFNDKPVETDFKVIIIYPEDPTVKNKRQGFYEKDSLYGRTDKSGKSVITVFLRNLIPGYYNYTVAAKDEKGREITSQSSFYYGERSYYRNNGEGLEIVTDKDAYEKGDSITAYIFFPTGNTEMLLTYESKDIFYYKKISAKGNSVMIKEKLDDRFAPSFNISVVFIKEGKFFNNSKQVGVLARDKFLNITILPDKKQYKPGDNASYQLLVKDYKGNAIKNTELSFGVVDESIYAIKEDQSPDIKSFFYAPQFTYIPVANSYFYVQSYGTSRPVMVFDKNIDTGLMEKKGNGRLYGKITNKENKGIPEVKLILNNENNYYVITSDTSGNYDFVKIRTGAYSLYYVNYQNTITLIDKVVIEKEKKYNASVDYPIQINQFGRSTAGVINNQPLRGMQDMTGLQSAVVMEKSSANVMKSEYTEAVVRSNFADAAYWVPDVRTNENGIAEVKFKMPDNLTTWRTSVKGVTMNMVVGQGANKTITRKDLIIRMETPRFFREGDEITISTIVHNYLDEKKKTKITFNSENLTLLSSNINTPGYSTNLYNQKDGLYELTIDKNTELRIDWRVKVDIPYGEAKLKAEALTNSESDAMELKVPIIPKGMKEVKSVTAQMSDQKEDVLKFNIPDDVDLRSTKFSFAVAPSLAGSMLKALDELAGYPYGCVEQTMSRFLPTIIAANTFRDLKVPLKSKTIAELPDIVDAGLKRLYNFQHQDGGWGWWTNDNTHPYMTAYVIYGMNLSQQAGYNIDKEIYAKGVENLYAQLSNTSQPDPTTEAFMIYALSSSPDQKYNSFIIDKIKGMETGKLNSYALSLNIISLMNVKANFRAEDYARSLAARSTNKGGMVFWSGKEWHYNWQDDNVQTTSFAVKALIKAGVQPELISKAVSWLMLQKDGYSWRSTQQTAAVIFALSDYLKMTNELNPDYSYIVYLNDKKVDSKRVVTADIYNQPVEIKIDGSKENLLVKGENKVKIVKEGTGRLYFSGVSQYYTQNEKSAVKGTSFSVRREYYLLKQEEKDGRIIYTKHAYNGDMKSGDEMLVKTFVDTKEDNLQYFILEDMLPSGFETIKDENKYEIEGEGNYHIYPYGNRRGYNPWRWFYADKEYRDQKVSYFVTNVNRDMEFSYLMRAQIPGKVTVSPALAYLMYYPEVNGNSGWVEFNVKDN